MIALRADNPEHLLGNGAQNTLDHFDNAYAALGRPGPLLLDDFLLSEDENQWWLKRVSAKCGKESVECKWVAAHAEAFASVGAEWPPSRAAMTEACGPEWLRLLPRREAEIVQYIAVTKPLELECDGSLTEDREAWETKLHSYCTTGTMTRLRLWRSRNKE